MEAMTSLLTLGHMPRADVAWRASRSTQLRLPDGLASHERASCAVFFDGSTYGPPRGKGCQGTVKSDPRAMSKLKACLEQ
jgi:hypothetical protein